MEEGKKGFIIYTDVKETLDNLSDEDVGKLFRGIVNYEVSGDDPDFSGELKFAFIPIRQQLDRDSAKWEHKKQVRAEAGKMGGVAKASKSSKAKQNLANVANANFAKQNVANLANATFAKQKKQNLAKLAVNVNVNDNVNVNGNVNVSDSFEAVPDGPAPLSSLLISYLNEKAGTNYNVTAAVVRRIGELMDAGYTADDMKSVIDKKVSEWKDSDKMRGYLRPRTLFGDKFEEYVSAPVPLEIENQQKEEEKRREITEKLQEERTSKTEKLSSILDRLQVIRDGPGGIKSAWQEFQELNERRVVLEQDLEFIDKKLGRLQA